MGSVKKGMLIAMEDYLNNEEYSEFQNIIDDEFIKANKMLIVKSFIIILLLYYLTHHKVVKYQL